MLQRLCRSVAHSPADWPSEWPVPATLAEAAVLIALQPVGEGFDVLLTRRTDHLFHHPGQISFPGGRIEAEDGDAVACALRESEEEIGLPASAVEVLGRLPRYHTGTGFRIVPVLGVIREAVALRADPFEVAEIFSVPLALVCDDRRYQRHRVRRNGVELHFQVLPHAGRFIWGATAGMLAMLGKLAGDSR